MQVWKLLGWLQKTRCVCKEVSRRGKIKCWGLKETFVLSELLEALSCNLTLFHIFVFHTFSWQNKLKSQYHKCICLSMNEGENWIHAWYKMWSRIPVWTDFTFNTTAYFVVMVLYWGGFSYIKKSLHNIILFFHQFLFVKIS